MEPADLILSLDAFARSIEVNRNVPNAFFMGAGTSISSGVPAVWKCIWEWKKRIFLSNNVGLEEQFHDISLASIQERIQYWLDDQGVYPPLNSPEEYGFYVERCYPIAEDRRQYFQELAAAASPHLGYKLLCLLAEAGVIKSTWTTNFDAFTARAAKGFSITPIEVGLDTSNRVVRQPRAGELLCVSLHGEYRYDSLKNTPPELQQQNETLSAAFIDYMRNATLIVVGYSGRDASVMEMLTKAYSLAGPGRLYWCGHEQPEPDPIIKDLLLTARQNGRIAYYISTYGFDDLMRRLALNCLKNDALAKAKELCTLHPEDVTPPPFEVAATAVETLARSNCFAIECPSELLQFKAKGYNAPGAWKRLRAAIASKKVVAGLMKDFILAIGTIDDVKDAFGTDLEGEIKRSPITEKELSMEDGKVISILRSALINAFAEAHDLNTNGKNLLWHKTSSRTEYVGGVRCKVYEAARISLCRYGGVQYLVIKPSIRGSDANDNPVSAEIEKELKRKVLTSQYNDKYAKALNAWQALLLSNGSNCYDYPPNAASTFRFVIKRTAALAKICTPRPQYPRTLDNNIARCVAFNGTRFEEPKLRFSNKDGDSFVTDTHPIRGIVRNRPYDYTMTARSIVQEVHLGVVCPQPDAQKLYGYLCDLHQSKQPTSRAEYLLPYPGFAQAFGISLNIPLANGSGWSSYNEPPTNTNAEKGASLLAQNIIRSIDALRASAHPSVVLIFVPDRLEQWKRYKTAASRFDLHDFVKAYCVQKGITTQFIEESTLKHQHQCEVLWWLALSFYTKTMLTPWVLDTIDRHTAFMGIGYSVNSSIDKGQQITLGCSHIYSADGRGLQYRLRKLDDVILDRMGNPYMSRDDARRLGESVRQLFFDAFGGLPQRAVIHKRTHFKKEEKEGLLEGLQGISNVDMLEISMDSALRYTAMRYQQSWQFDGFPIRRGTAVVLDKRRALLWVHGAAESVLQSNRSFYLGKSRIPTPLLIVRHYGMSPLEVLAREVLGLSKMNWNTFDMYTKMPATIQSSNAIAQIGSLLERFSSASYDYRLFT